jgi:hypothetical protein
MYLSPLGYPLGVEGAAPLRATREGFAEQALRPPGFRVRQREEPTRPQPADTGPRATEMSWDRLNWCPMAAAAGQRPFAGGRHLARPV